MILVSSEHAIIAWYQFKMADCHVVVVFVSYRYLFRFPCLNVKISWEEGEDMS